MYEFECLTTNNEVAINEQACSPFLGGCYPEAEDCCGPDCSPNDGCDCSPDFSYSDCSPDDGRL